MSETDNRPQIRPIAHGNDGAMTKVRAPDMEVVTKGWWTLRVERKPVDEVEAESRARRAKG